MLMFQLFTVLCSLPHCTLGRCLSCLTLFPALNKYNPVSYFKYQYFRNWILQNWKQKILGNRLNKAKHLLVQSWSQSINCYNPLCFCLCALKCRQKYWNFVGLFFCQISSHNALIPAQSLILIYLTKAFCYFSNNIPVQ